MSWVNIWKLQANNLNQEEMYNFIDLHNKEMNRAVKFPTKKAFCIHR